MKHGLLLCTLLLAVAAVAQTEDPAWKRSFLLSRGGDAFAKGHFSEAEKLFEYVLAIDANDEQALVYSAALQKQKGLIDKAIVFLARGAAAHPGSYALQFELGAALLSTGKPQEAVAHLRAAARLNPSSVDALVNLGDALSLTNQREAAYVNYGAAIGLNATSAWARRQAAACAFEIKRPDEALAHLAVAMKAYPDDWSLVLLQGHSYSQLGSTARALEAYQRVSSLAPKSELGPLFAGIALEKTGRFDEAKAEYEKAVQITPASAPARMQLGNLLRAQKQRDAARTHYEAALKSEPSNLWALAQLGFLELEMHRPSGALLLLGKAFAINPNDFDVGVGVGDAYQELKKFNEALAQYDAVLMRKPSHLPALVKSGDAARMLGDFDGALARYAEAARLHTKSAWALISYGDGLRLKNRAAEAKTQYLKALAAEPDSKWAQRQLGFSLFELREFEKASAVLAPLVTAETHEPDLLLVAGHLAVNRGALDEATGLYERARALRPQHAPTFLFMADVWQRRGDFTQAEIALNQALSLDPNFVDALVLSGDVQRRSASALQPPDPAAAKAKRQRARAAYAKAVALSEKNEWAEHQLGFVAFELGDDETAQKALLAVRPSFPQDGELVLTLGFLADNRKDALAARGLFLEASQLLPNDVRPWVFAARATLVLERFDEADALFVKGLAVAPESGWAHLERGYGQRLRRNWQGASSSARKAVQYAPSNPEAWLFLGRLSQEQRDAEGAVTAYERAALLAPQSAIVDRALASALTNRGLPGDLIHGEALLVRPLQELADAGYTHAVAGYLMVKLTKVPESQLPPPPVPETRENRKRRWAELGAFELTRALELAPGDRAMRLAAAVSFYELDRFDEAKTSADILVAGGNRVCPTDEWKWKWELPKVSSEQRLTQTNEEAAVEEDAQLRSEAHLLLGELLGRSEDNQVASRLAYFCSLVWSDRAEGHLRIAASYEARGLLKLAEEHFVAASILDPGSKPAKEGLERLRKEGGFPIGPVRASGLVTLVSQPLEGEVQARQASVLGDALRDKTTLLTTPRTFALEADASYQRVQWQSTLRFGLGYQFAYGFNTFLTDQQTFEDRRSHRAELMASGRYEFEDRRYELSWRASYRLTIADATSRSEVRNGLFASARLLRVEWGTADAELGYELGLFNPRAGALITDPMGHAGIVGLRLNPFFRQAQIEVSFGYRGEVSWLRPSNRNIWLHEFRIDGRKLWTRWFLGGDLRGGVTADARPAGAGVTSGAGSVGLRGNFGYAWSGYSRALVRSGFQWVPATPEWNSFTVGVLAEHRFVFRGVGDSDQGLAAFISYDARVWPAFSRVEHLITVMVSIGR